MKALLLLLLLGALSPALTAAEDSPLIVTVLRYNPPDNDREAAHWSSFFEAELETSLSWIDSVRCRDDTYAVRKLGLAPTDRITHSQAAEAGRLLESAHAIYGTLTFGDGRWTIVTTIVDPSSEGAESFALDGDHVWDLRDRLVTEVATRLKAPITPDEREIAYDRWITHPDNFPIAAKLTYLSSINGSIQEALTLSQQCLDLEPENTEIMTRHAGLLYSNALPLKSRDALEKAIELGCRGPQARLLLAQILRSTGADAQARELIRTAYEEHPNSVSVLRNLAVHYLHREKDPTESLKYLQRAQNSDPFDAMVAATICSAQARAGNRAAAERALARAITLSAGEPPLINEEYSIGLAARELGEAPTSLRALKRCHSQAQLEKVGEKWVTSIGKSIEAIERRLKKTPVAATRPRIYSREELEQALDKTLTDEERRNLIFPLGINEKMRKWAQELVGGIEDPEEKARVLFDTMSTRLGTLTRAGVRTAEEVFEEWENPSTRFSCQEYAKLFVVLGREVGLDTFLTYIEEDYSEDHIYHCCAALFLEEECFLVDPSYHWFGAPHKTYVLLDDVQAIAGQLSQPDGKLNNEDSLKRTRTALKLYPDWDYGLGMLTRCLLNVDRVNDAKRTLDKRKELHPEAWDTPLFLSKLSYKEERFEDAERHAATFVENHPHDSNGHAALAAALARRSKYVEAREHYRECLRRDPDAHIRQQVLKNLASLNFHLGHGSDSALARGLQKLTDKDYAGAETEYLKAIEEDPNSRPLHWKLGYIRNKLGKTQQAAESVIKFLALQTEDLTPDTIEYTVGRLQRQDMSRESIIVLRWGLERFPNNATLILALSSCHHLLKDFDNGLATALQAHASLNNKRSQVWLAFIYANVGEWETAETILRDELTPPIKEIAIQEVATRSAGVLTQLGRFDSVTLYLNDMEELANPDLLQTTRKELSIYQKWEAQLFRLIAQGKQKDDEEVLDLLQSLSRRLAFPATTTAQLESYFAAHPEDFSGKDAERELTIFSVAPDEKGTPAVLAKEIRDQLVTGTPIKDAAGEAAEAGLIRIGDRTWSKREDVATILQDAAFGTKIGTVSPIITHKGYHMFCLVHATRGGGEVSLEQPVIRALVRKAVLSTRREEWETRYWNSLHRRIDENQPQQEPAP